VSCELVQVALGKMQGILTGERACNPHPAYVDGEMLAVTNKCMGGRIWWPFSLSILFALATSGVLCEFI
jgi:hypothetical protein